MKRPTPPGKTFAQALKDTFDKAANQFGQQHNRKRSTRKRLIPVGSGPWLWNPSYLRKARFMIVTAEVLVLFGLIGIGLATEGHDAYWLLCYLGGLGGIWGILGGVTIIRTESCAKAQQMDKQTITAREKMTCPSGTKSA